MTSFPTTTFQQDVHVPASPARVYDILVTPELHAAFTGQPALHTDRLDLDFQTYGGYASGRNLELVPGQRIHQTWRAQMEPWPAHHFSYVTLELQAEGTGTRLRLTHTDVPAHLAESMAQGWHQWYWQPLQDYLSVHAWA